MTMDHTADQLVFLNKFCKDGRVVLHRYGCASSGQDPVYHVSLNRGVRYSIPTLSLSGYMAEGYRRLDWRCRGSAIVSVRDTVTAFLTRSLSFAIIERMWWVEGEVRIFAIFKGFFGNFELPAAHATSLSGNS